MMENSDTGVGRKIVRASMAVALAHIIFKLIGFVQTVAVGRHLDNSTYDGVYSFAFEGCILTLFLLGEEAIGPAFLPVFKGELDKDDARSAWSFANTVLTLQFPILLAATAGVMLFPDAVIHLVTAWDPVSDPAKVALARRSLVWLAPALICLSLGSTTYMILNGHKRFFAAALGDASWKLCALLAILVGMGVMGFDYRALIVGLVVGSVAKLATHVAGMGRHAVRLRPAFNWRSPAMRRLLLLMLPLIVGIVFAKVRDIFNNVTVLSTLEAEGLMKANSLGRKLYTTLGWLVPYAISIAMFPFLCEMVDRKDRVGVGRLLTQSSRMLLAVFVPFSLVCVVLAYPICTVLYYSAANTPLETVRWIAVSTACYTLVFPAFALEFLFMQAFFAHRRMVSITVVGVIFSALSIAVSYVGVVVMGAEGAVGLAVVALGYTLSRALKTTTLVGLLRKNAAILPLRETGPFALRIGIVALVSAGAAYGTICLVNPLLANRAVRTAALLKLGAGGCAAVVTYLLGIWLLKIGEPAEMVRWAYARISGRRKENEA